MSSISSPAINRTEESGPSATVTSEFASPVVYDNFYTPSNAAFYARHRYADLDSSKHEVRLLKLLPGSRTEPLEAELVSNCFLIPGSLIRGYLAISYCAGDPRDTVPILVNGITFNVFASLGHALRRIRAGREEAESKGRAQLVWVD